MIDGCLCLNTETFDKEYARKPEANIPSFG